MDPTRKMDQVCLSDGFAEKWKWFHTKRRSNLDLARKNDGNGYLEVFFRVQTPENEQPEVYCVFGCTGGAVDPRNHVAAPNWPAHQARSTKAARAGGGR